MLDRLLHTSWYCTNLAARPRGVVAIDATTDAAALWFGPVVSILEELVEKLPADRQPDIAFLGDRSTYSLAEILTALTASPTPAPRLDITSQLGRYPVLGPLLWALSREPHRPLAVIGTTPILDIEDWAGSKYTRGMIVYRLLGDTKISHPDCHELEPNADLSVVVEHLRDPITSIRIGHDAGIVLDWENDSYQWEGGWLLGTGESLDTTLQMMLPHGQEPEATLHTRSGATYRQRLTSTPPPRTTSVIPLTPSEGNVLNLWRRGAGFWCGACSQTHSPGQVWCRACTNHHGLFPSLQSHSAPVYTVRCRVGEWFATPVPRGIVRISDTAIAIARPGIHLDYRYEEGRWIASDAGPGQFREFDRDEFLIRCEPGE